MAQRLCANASQHHKPDNAVPLEQDIREEAPTLILGLMGFSREQHTLLASLLPERSESPVKWRAGSLAAADAWIANGARIQILGDGSLRIGSGEAGSRSVRLALDEVDRPIAFSEPLASRDFEPALSFRADQVHSLDAVLETFHTRWLASKAACLWLGSRLVWAQHTLTQPVYHLTQNGRLLAAIHRTGEVGLMPGVGVAELRAATWDGRPSSAAYIPQAFHRTTISELVWTYAVRAEADLLPARYRSARIHFRRPPKVAQRLIHDDHLSVMQQLVPGAACFDELRDRMDLGSIRLARTLAALYLAGSVTTNPQRARSAWLDTRSVEGGSNDESMWSPTRTRSVFGSPAGLPRLAFTVPAHLPARPRSGGAACTPASS